MNNINIFAKYVCLHIELLKKYNVKNIFRLAITAFVINNLVNRPNQKKDLLEEFFGTLKSNIYIKKNNFKNSIYGIDFLKDNNLIKVVDGNVISININKDISIISDYEKSIILEVNKINDYIFFRMVLQNV